MTRVTPLRSANRRRRSAEAAARRPRSTSSSRRSWEPPSIRARSSISLTIWARWPVSTSIRAIRSRIWSGTSAASASRASVSGEQRDRRQRRPELVAQVVDELGADLLEPAQLRDVLEDHEQVVGPGAAWARSTRRAAVGAAHAVLDRRPTRRPARRRAPPRAARRGTSPSRSGRRAGPVAVPSSTWAAGVRRAYPAVAADVQHADRDEVHAPSPPSMRTAPAFSPAVVTGSGPLPAALRPSRPASSRRTACPTSGCTRSSPAPTSTRRSPSTRRSGSGGPTARCARTRTRSSSATTWRIHLAGIDGFDPEQSYASVIIVVPDPDALYASFAAGLRAAYGKLPVAGDPADGPAAQALGHGLRVQRRRRGRQLAAVLEAGGHGGGGRGGRARARAPGGRRGAARGLERRRRGRRWRRWGGRSTRYPDAPAIERARALLYRADLAVRLGDEALAAASLAEAARRARCRTNGRRIAAGPDARRATLRPRQARSCDRLALSAEALSARGGRPARAFRSGAGPPRHHRSSPRPRRRRAPRRSPAGTRAGAPSRGRSSRPAAGPASRPPARGPPPARRPRRRAPPGTPRSAAPRPRRGPAASGQGRSSPAIPCEARRNAASSSRVRRRAPGRRSRRPRTVRAVARLVQRRVPRAQQAVARAPAERLRQHVVQERRQHQLRRDAEQPLAQPDLRPAVGRDAARRAPPRRPRTTACASGGEEPPDRGEERDRRRLRGGQPVQLVRRQALDPVQEPGEALRRVAADEVGAGGPRARRARAVARGAGWRGPRHARRPRPAPGRRDPRRRARPARGAPRRSGRGARGRSASRARR